MILFGEMDVFLELCTISLFGGNRAYIHLENYDLQEVFIKKTNSILTWKQCSSNRDG
jgi:hypothetical protein